MEFGTNGTTGTNDRNHIRADGDNLKYNTCADGKHIFEQNGSESMQIDSSGRLLLGNSVLPPDSDSDTKLYISSSGGPKIRFHRQDATITEGDLLGAVIGSATDGSATSACQISLVADAEHSANDSPGRITFSTTADGASSSTEKMRITSSGHVLIGRISYGRTGNGHTIRGDDSAVFSRDATGETMMVCRNDSQGDLIQFRRNDTICGEIRNIGGTSVAYQTSSDYRLKENVVDIADGISRVKQLQPKRFNFIADDTKTVDGFIAHEAQTVVPEAVSGTKDEVNADGDAVMQGIDQAKLVPLLTAALQEAIAKIETLETKVAALEAG